MKNTFRFAALLCAIALLVTACTKDETFEPQVEPAADGSEIIFGSRAGFENPDGTRTEYSGEFYTGANGGTFERIDWVHGADVVEIYCGKATNGPTAHYSVNGQSTDSDTNTDTSITTDEFDEGYLVKVDDSALQWNGDDTHKFYAMYPSSQMQSITANTTLAQGVKMDGSVLTGIVPRAQQAIEVTKVGNTHYAKPNMTYAYMAAKATAKRADAAVKLDFVPVVTALQVELQAQNVEVTIESLRVRGTGIAGKFTADLENDWTGTYPTCKAVSDDSESNVIQFSLNQDLTIGVGESLVFTVFLRPGADYTNIEVGFSQTGADLHMNTIGSAANPVTIPSYKKSVVNDVLLPKTEDELVIDASRWMEQLDNSMNMARLSLPGAGGAFSSGASDGYKQQTLGFEDLWKAGVRAFEISVDRVNETPNSVEEASSLGSQPVLCNGEPVGVNLEDVVKDLVDKVYTGTETAMIILTYQPIDASPNRNGERFAYNLRKFYNTLIGGNVTTDAGHTITESDFVLYTPSTILGAKENALDARGKVMIVVRPTQHDETDNGGDDTWTNIKSALSGTKILALNGCGTAKDRWGKRGYKVRNSTALDICNNINSSTPNVEYYLKQTGGVFSGWNWPDYTNVTKQNADFTYETDEGFSCWYQDWARVVSLEHLGASGYYQYRITAAADYRWYESLQEKKDNVEETFVQALKSTNETKTIYINSLCGYLVDPAYKASCYPYPDFYIDGTTTISGGSAGNIQALATILNEFLDDIVTEAGLLQETGPTGVVLMDMVTANSSAIGAIISNNFKF